MSVNNTWLNYPFVSQYVMADGRRGFSSKVLISFAIDKLLFKKKKWRWPITIAKRKFDMLVFSYSLLVKFAREVQDLLITLGQNSK